MAWGLFFFLAALGLLTVGIVGGLIFLALRQAAPRAGRMVAWVAGALMLASLAPAPLPPGVSLIGGVVTADAVLPLDVDEGAPVTFSGDGSGRVERAEDGSARLVIECPSGRCFFSAGSTRAHWPPYVHSATFRDIMRPTAMVQGGEVQVWEGHAACEPVPLLFATLFGGFSCEPGCRDVYAANGTGAVVLRATGARICA